MHECQKTYYKNLFKEPFSQEFVLSLQPNYIIKKTMINRFVLNEVSYFGPGAREVLPQEIKRLGLHKAFVATDKDLIKFGVADKVLKVLENAGIPYEIFSEIKPNPTVSNVKAGVEAFAKSGAVRLSILRKRLVSSLIIQTSVMWCHWKVWLLQGKSQCLSLHCPLPPVLPPR